MVGFIDQLAITMSQQGLSILSEAFKHYANLGIAQMGVLFSTVALGAVAGMIPSGIVLARYGSKTVAWVSGVGIVAIMGVLAWFLPRDFAPLIILLGLVGFFLPALSLTGTAAITRVYEGRKNRGSAIGLRQAATPLGGIVAAGLFPLLLRKWNLKIVLVLIAVNVGVWRFFFAWLLPSPPRNPSNSQDHNAMDLNCQRIRQTVLALRIPLLISLLLSPGQYALLTYAILDLQARWRVSIIVAGGVIALALFAGFAARIGAGLLSDHKMSVLRPFRLVILTGVLSLLVWTTIPDFIPFWVVLPVFIGLGAGLDGWNGLLTAWVTERTTSAERGMALALTGMAGFIGIGLFLPVFGEIAKFFASYRPAWALLGLFYLLGLIIIAKSQGSN